ncbi:hypothetical protein [Halorarum salinum]|uniref:Phage head morphogenesis domain-containing protein n=1 Tax=Halorarum salinum TaxID=2743089 RepID=A0A7D5LC79_9EURY|nr:hypothetical protein [Halobaculum salinum]QLG63091.1 hypothetical protein HUG12_15665 [Halobaculum salinum]
MSSACGHRHHLTAQDYALDEAGRADPTSTTTVQRAYARFLRGRVGSLNADVRQLLVDEDALGLASSVGGRWGGLSPAETARRFDEWMERAIQAEVLDPHDSRKVRDWFERASKQALRTANGELRRFGVDVDPAEDVIAQDVVQQSIDLQQEDARQRVASWMDDYRTDARSLVTAGVAGEVAKSALATDISERAQVYKSHTTATASGRVVNQYNTTKLTAYDRVDADVELDVEAEFRTAGDDRVCSLCQSLSGTYTLEEAQQLTIPDDTHNLCRCQWIVTDVQELF